jgi:hypothetical protein
MTNTNPSRPIPDAKGSVGDLSLESANRVLTNLVAPDDFENILDEALPPLVRSFSQCPKGTGAQALGSVVESLLSIPPGSGTNLFGSSGPIMRVTPASDFLVSGIEGTDFGTLVATYTVRNDGGEQLVWTATLLNALPWIILSDTSGVLQVGGSQAITVTLDSAVLSTLAIGQYSDTVLFVNTGDGVGDTSRQVVVAVSDSSTTAPTDLSYPTLLTSYVVGLSIGDNDPQVTGTPDFYTVSPPLPAGLEVDFLTGIVDGFPTNITASDTYEFRATNGAGFASALLALEIVGDPSDDLITSLRYEPNPLELPVGIQMTTVLPIVTGGIPTSYVVDSDLPLGMELEPTAGFIFGLPVEVTAAKIYKITASNSAGPISYDLTVETTGTPVTSVTYTPSTLTLTSGSAITPIVPDTTGGGATTYTTDPDITVATGLSINPANGTLSGVPIGPVTDEQIVVTASNAFNTDGGATTTLTITISDDGPANLQYSDNPATLFAGVFATLTPSNSGGFITGYTVSPTLSPSLIIDSVTGWITGIPDSEAPLASYLVEGSNAYGTATVVLDITVNPSPPTNPNYNPNVLVGTIGSALTPVTPTVSTGTSLTWSPNVALPTGCIFSPATGRISGTPGLGTTQDASTYVSTVYNVSGSVSTTFSLEINPRPLGDLSYSPNPLDTLVGQAVYLSPNMSPSDAAEYSADSLPLGLSIGSVTGVISGTPLEEDPNDDPTGLSYPISDYNLEAGDLLLDQTPSLDSGIADQYSISNTLPSGLSFSTTTGVFGGTPDFLTPNSQYTITATNIASGAFASTIIDVEVRDDPPADDPLGPYYPQTSYSLRVGDTLDPQIPMLASGTADIWDINKALPTGITFSSPTGTIEGVASIATASDTYTVTATNNTTMTSDTVDITMVVTDPPPPVEDGDLVAEFIINTGITNWFPARATLPLPPGYTYERDKCPFTLYDPPTNLLGASFSPMSTQWEAVSYYPNGDVAVVEVIGRAYRGDGRFVNGTPELFTLALISPAVIGSPDVHFQIDNLLASPGSVYVATFDVHGNEYRADIVPSPALLTEIKLGPAWRTTHYHAPLRPVAPNGTTRGHMGGMHVYLSTTPNVVAAGLDLVWHNGMVGSPSSPSEEVEWDMFYEKLQLVLPNTPIDWSIGTTRPETFLSAKDTVGSTNVYDLIRPMADGTIHVMGNTRARDFRLSIYQDGLAGQGNLFTEYRGWGTVVASDFAGRRGWSWYNGDCAGYGTSRQRLPEKGPFIGGLVGSWKGKRDTMKDSITNMFDPVPGNNQSQVSMFRNFLEVTKLTKIDPGESRTTVEGMFTFPKGGVEIVLSDQEGTHSDGSWARGSPLRRIPSHWRGGKAPFLDEQATSAQTAPKILPGGSFEWVGNILRKTGLTTLITVDSPNKIYIDWDSPNYGDYTTNNPSFTPTKAAVDTDNWDIRLPHAISTGTEWPYFIADSSYGGKSGGEGIEPFYAIDGIWEGGREALEYVNMISAAYMQRHRGAFFRTDGSLMRIEDYAPTGALPWTMSASAGVWTIQGQWAYSAYNDLPFGFYSLSDKSHEVEVAAQRRSPGYHVSFTKLNYDTTDGLGNAGGVGGYDPIDFQHQIRVTRTLEWSAWLSNDPISKLNAEWVAEAGRMHSNERLGSNGSLGNVATYTPANFGAQSLGRADAWLWTASALNYALRSPASGRSDWSPYFRATTNALDRIRTPNGAWSIFNSGKVIDNNDFNKMYSVGQQIEHVYLMFGETAIIESVFTGVAGFSAIEAAAVNNVTQGGDNLWNFQWVWKSPNDPGYSAPNSSRPWAYIAFRDGISNNGTLFNTHADHPPEQYTASVDHFPTPTGLGSWQRYSPDSVDLSLSLVSYSNNQDPLTYFEGQALDNLENYAGIIGTLQERLYASGGGGLKSLSSSVYTIRASNEAGESVTNQTINVGNGAPSGLTYTPNPAKALSGSPLTLTPILDPDGGFPTTWEISPVLFSGFVLDPITGVISGSSTTQPDTSFLVTGTNFFGSDTDTLSIEILASPISPPTNYRYSPAEVKRLIRDKGPVAITPSYDGDLPFTSASVTLTPVLANTTLTPPVGTISVPYDIIGGEEVFPITSGAPIPFHPLEKNPPHPNEVLHVYLPRGTKPATGWPTIFVNGSAVYLGSLPPDSLKPDLASDRTIIKALNAKYAVVYFGTSSSGFGVETGFFKSPTTPEWLDWNYHMPEKAPVMAIQWGKLNAATYDLDPKWFYTLGDSSGANINAYATLGPDRAFVGGSLQTRQSTRVAGVVNLEGICTFTAYDSPFSAGMNHFESVSNPGNPAIDISDVDPADLAAVSFAALIAHPSSNAPFTPVISLYDEAIGSTDYGQQDLTGFPGLSGTLLADVHDTWNGAMIHTMLRQADSPLHAAKSEFWHKSPIGALGDASPLVTGTFLEGVLASPAGERVISWLTDRLGGSAPDPDGLRIVPTSGNIFGTPLVLDPLSNRAVSASNSAGSTTASLLLSVLIPSPVSLSYSDTTPEWKIDELITPLTPTWEAEGVPVFSINPTLPSGMSIDSFDGIIAGTPGGFETDVPRDITLSNTTGFITATITSSVTDDPPFIVNYTPNPGVYAEGDALYSSPTTTGTITNWIIDNDVPLTHAYTFNSATGIFSGIASPDGTFNYKVTASSQFGTSNTIDVSFSISNTDPTVLAFDSSFSYLPAESTQPNSFMKANVWLPETTAPAAGFPVVVEFKATTYTDTSPRATINSAADPFLFESLANGVAVVSVGIAGSNPLYLAGGGLYHSESDPVYGINFDAYWPERSAIWAIQGLREQIATAGLLIDPTKIYTDGDGAGAELALNVALGVDRARVGMSQVQRSTRVAGVLASRPGSSWWPALLTTLSSDHFSAATDGNTPADTYGDANYADLVSASTIDLALKQSSLTKLLNGTIPMFLWSQDSLSDTNVTVTGDSPELTNTLSNPKDQWHSQVLFSQILALDSPFQSAESEFLVPTSLATGLFETDTLASLDISESPVQIRKRVWLLGSLASSDQRIPTISYAPDMVTLLQDEAILPPITPHVVGAPPFTFSIDLPLPTGVVFNESTGQFSGTPTDLSNLIEYTVTVDNDFGQATAPIHLGVNPQGPSGFSYNPDTYSLTVDVALTPISPVITGQVDGYLISDTPPVGIIFSPAVGRFTGSPKEAFAQNTFTITAFNVTDSVDADLTLTVVDENPSSPFYPLSDYDLEVGTFLDAQVPQLTSGFADQWSIDPQLPQGLGFTTTNGEFSGTPSLATLDASYTITATNTQTAATATVVITVAVVDAATPPSDLSYPGNYFGLQVGRTITPVAPTVTGVVDLYASVPLLPAGIDLDPLSGIISGQPDPGTEGAGLYVITASNAAGPTTASVGIIIAPAGAVQLTPDFSNAGYVPTDFGNLVTGFGQLNAWAPPAQLAFQTPIPILITTESLGFLPTTAIPVIDSLLNPLEYLAYQAGVLVISLDLPGNSTQFFDSGCFRDPESSTEGPQYDSPALGHYFPERYFSFAVQFIKDLIANNFLVADADNIVVKGTGSGAAIAAWCALGIDRAYTTGSGQLQTSTKVQGIIASNPLIDYTALADIINPTPTDVGHWANPEAGLVAATKLSQVSAIRKERASVAHYVLDPASLAANTATLILADNTLTSTDFTFTALGYPALTDTLVGTPEDLWHSYMLKRMLDAKDPVFHGVHTHLAIDETVAAGHGEDVTFAGGVDGFEAQALALQWMLNLYKGKLDGSEDPPTTLTYAPAGPYTFPETEAITKLVPSNTGGTIISYSVVPDLPAGLDLNIFSGGITGTPTAITADQPYRVTGENSGGITFIDLDIEVVASSVTAPTNLTYFPSPPYVFTQNASIPTLIPSYDGGLPSVTFVSNPTLPQGLSIGQTTGMITGAPVNEIVVPENFTITASNSAGSADEILTMSVNADAGGDPEGTIWGINIGGLSYSRLVQSFSDIMKRSFFWFVQGASNVVTETIPDGQLGAGYPDPALPPEFGEAQTPIFVAEQGGIPPGITRLVWLGGDAQSCVLVSVPAELATFSSQGRAGDWYYREYDLDPTAGNTLNVYLNSNPNVLDPVRDIHLWNPGSTFPDSPADPGRPPLFLPSWDLKHSIHKNGAGYPDVVRFLGWTGVNRYGRESAPSLPPPPTEITTAGPWASPTRYTYGRDEGTPYEVMVAICNKWGAKPWFPLVHRGRGDGSDVLSSPDYVTHLEKTFDIILNGRMDAEGVFWPGLNIELDYVLEWANETWNTGFPVSQWLAQNTSTLQGAARDQKKAEIQAREMELIYTAIANVATPAQLDRMQFFLGGTNADQNYMSRAYQELSPTFQTDVLTCGGPPGYWLIPSDRTGGDFDYAYLWNTGTPESPIFPNLPSSPGQVIADALEFGFPKLIPRMAAQATFMRDNNKEFWVYEHSYGTIPTGPQGIPPDGWVGYAWAACSHPDLFDAQRRAAQELIIDNGCTVCCIFTMDAALIQESRDGYWGPYDSANDVLLNVPVDPDNYIHENFPKWSAYILGNEGLTIPPLWPNV